MVDWAFSQPGVRIVRVLAPVWNTPAVHVAEKVGLRPVGSYEDDEVGEVLIYEMVKP
jgi:RimJ/RimL family protein N-acetyltransferase